MKNNIVYRAITFIVKLIKKPENSHPLNYSLPIHPWHSYYLPVSEFRRKKLEKNVITLYKNNISYRLHEGFEAHVGDYKFYLTTDRVMKIEGNFTIGFGVEKFISIIREQKK
jgi:hypothetical protein